MLRFNKNGDFNLPVGNVDFNANVVNALEAYFMQVISKKPKWFNIDYKDFLQKIRLSEKDFVYLDHILSHLVNIISYGMSKMKLSCCNYWIA